MPENHNYETPRILHDWPLRDNDQAVFNFEDFAATLARLIADKNTRTPLTIGVSGAWGSGKTTLLRRVRRMLNQTKVLNDASRPAIMDFVNDSENPQKMFRSCRSVWFNAWKYADEEQLLVALVRVIVQTMATDGVVNQVIGKLLDPAYPRRDVVNTVLSWFSIKVDGVGLELNTGTPQPTPFTEKTAILDLFDDAFGRLIAAWVHHRADVQAINPAEGVLVVFIDDLDRCLPAKMVQVLEAIKLFMDKEGCVFVLGADTAVIQQAVTKHYKDAGVTGENASDYLEKLIQLRFNLPPIPDDDMGGFVRTQVEDESLGAHWKIVAFGAEANPRKVKTFLNDLRLQWTIWKNTGQAKGMDFDDFVRWEVLMRSAPLFRKRVYGMYDPELRAEMIGKAFDWAAGKEEAAASFQGDLNEQLRRVLKDVQQHRAHFTPVVIDHLVHLMAPQPVPIVAEKPAETPETRPAETLETAFGLEPELEEAVSKGPVMRGGEPSSTVRRPPSSDAKRMTIGGIEFVKIPAGKFIMGSKDDNKLASDQEKPQHTVEIPQDYWMARFPVTNRCFDAFVKATGYQTTAEKVGLAYAFDGIQWSDTKGASWQHPHGPKSALNGREGHPVVSVTWDDAQAYCQWFNQQYRAELGSLTLRLPTEAEWEKAARGEYGNEWPWGNEVPDSRRCNFDMYIKDTTPVGQYSPQGDSPYGCADMAGNVWEWCLDWYNENEYKHRLGQLVSDPQGPKMGSYHVLRGGAFEYNSGSVRCANRGGNLPDRRGDRYGFRVLVSPISLKSDL